MRCKASQSKKKQEFSFSQEMQAIAVTPTVKLIIQIVYEGFSPLSTSCLYLAAGLLRGASSSRCPSASRLPSPSRPSLLAFAHAPPSPGASKIKRSFKILNKKSVRRLKFRKSLPEVEVLFCNSHLHSVSCLVVAVA